MHTVVKVSFSSEDVAEMINKRKQEMAGGLSEQEQRQLEESLRSFETERARSQWQTYYRFKCLYKTYGGAVIFQQANPLEPVGAIRTHLEKLQSEGKLKINNPDYAEHFWRYYKADYSYVIPPEKVDFSQPWWQRINP